MTIFEAAFKLVIAFCIYYYGGDKLILLSILTAIQSAIRQTVYWIYCKRNFEECVYTKGRNRQIEKAFSILPVGILLGLVRLYYETRE